MNSTLRKLPAIGLILMLLASILTATQNPLRVKIYSDYGLFTVAPKPTAILTPLPILPPGSTVRTIRGSNLMFRVAGGIMFDAVGQPCDQLTTKRLRLSYDKSRGKRKQLVLHVNNRMFNVAGTDGRDLRAIAQFSDAMNPILVNATTRAIEEKESCKNPDGMLMVNLNPAFSRTQLSWLLTRMDSLAWSLSEGKRWATKDPLPGSSLEMGRQLKQALELDQEKYDAARYAILRFLVEKGPSALSTLDEETKGDLNRRLGDFSTDAWAKFEEEIVTEAEIDRDAFNKLNTTDRRLLLLVGLASGSQRVSNINDHESAAKFCVANSALEFSGTPRLEFFRVWYDSPRRFLTSSDLMSNNFSQLRLIDPEAYDATMEVYNLNGLFKYVKSQQSQNQWNRFVKSLPPKRQGDDIEIACPQCTKDQVTQWLACLESPD